MSDRVEYRAIAGDLARVIWFADGFDDRGPKGCQHEKSDDHGISAVRVHFTLIGPLSAVTFDVSSGWYPSTVWARGAPRGVLKPDGGAISLCYAEPRWKDHTKRESCPWLLGVEGCYPDVSYLAGDDAFRTLTDEGQDALWLYLETWLATEERRETA